MCILIDLLMEAKHKECSRNDYQCKSHSGPCYMEGPICKLINDVEEAYTEIKKGGKR